MSDLTKWPRLLVVGEPVSEAQADEIILRTTCWPYVRCNDPAWNIAVAYTVGLTPPKDYPYGEEKRLAERTSNPGLNYLYNSRISSSWIGGPHGWCDWDGTIGCDTYNIGKWPDESTVGDEWARIAAAFPYLRLRAQLVADEGMGEPILEWEIGQGRVHRRDPDGLLIPPRDLSEQQILLALAIVGGRGVPLHRLADAMRRFEAPPATSTPAGGWDENTEPAAAATQGAVS